MDGSPRVSRDSPEREGRPLAVHHLAGVPVDEDEHRLALVRILHEPDGGVQQLAVVRRRVDLDRLERVDALLRLLLDELVRERLRLRLRLRLADVSALDVHATGRALVEVQLVLQLELEAFFAPLSPWAIIPTPAPPPTFFVPWKSATTDVGTTQ